MDDKKISKNQKKMDRYEKVFNDPRFKPIPKKIHKVELNDNRFNAMFSNKDFYSSSKVDKYGKMKKEKSNKNQMEEYYIRKENQKTIKKEKEKSGKKLKINEKEKKEEENEEEENIEEKEGEGEEEESDTSEEFKEFLENMNQQNMEILKDEEVEENIPMGQETSRIAIQNIDWTNIHALDLFVLLNSFCKGSQKVLKVEIYPSEYGMKEMAKENAQGPDKEIFASEAIVQKAENTEKDEKNKKKDKNTNKKEKKEEKENLEDDENVENEDEENEDNEENEEEEDDIIDSSNEGFDPVELRKYELKKLKFYYAIAYCDSVETASSLYNECDGLEIERTQSFLDMRFVPDDLTKFPYPPKEVCDHMPANKEYTQEFKPNSALQDTKVKLTWDQGDPKRQDLISRAFHKEGFNEEDINELLVSSDSEDSELANEFGEDENDEDKEGNNIELNLLKKKRKMPKFKDGETIEIKFNKGFEGINPNVGNNEETQKENKSKWEKFKENKKNKRKEKKREERERKNKIRDKRKGNNTINEVNSEDNNDEKREEEIDKRADKNELDLLVDDRKKNMKEFKFNSKDERFQTKNNIDFAIDPTNKNYKKLKGKKNF